MPSCLKRAFFWLSWASNLWGSEGLSYHLGVAGSFFYMQETSPTQPYSVSFAASGVAADFLFLNPSPFQGEIVLAYHTLSHLRIQGRRQDLTKRSQDYYFIQPALLYRVGPLFYLRFFTDIFYTAPFYYNDQKMPRSSGFDVFLGLGPSFLREISHFVAIHALGELALNLTPVRGEFVGLNNLVALRYRLQLSLLYRIG